MAIKVKSRSKSWEENFLVTIRSYFRKNLLYFSIQLKFFCLFFFFFFFIKLLRFIIALLKYGSCLILVLSATVTQSYEEWLKKREFSRTVDDDFVYVLVELLKTIISFLMLCIVFRNPFRYVLFAWFYIYIYIYIYVL